MYCKNCGRELDEGAKFCTYCGTQTSVPGSANEAKEDENRWRQNETYSQTETSVKDIVSQKQPDRKHAGVVIAIVVVILVLLCVAGSFSIIMSNDEKEVSTNETLADASSSSSEATEIDLDDLSDLLYTDYSLDEYGLAFTLPSYWVESSSDGSYVFSAYIYDPTPGNFLIGIYESSYDDTDDAEILEAYRMDYALNAQLSWGVSVEADTYQTDENGFVELYAHDDSSYILTYSCVKNGYEYIFLLYSSEGIDELESYMKDVVDSISFSEIAVVSSNGQDSYESYSSGILMSDNLEDYTITIDGIVYQLPMTYSDLLAAGWSIDSKYHTEMDTVDPDRSVAFDVSKNENTISVTVSNLSGNVREVSECSVTELSIYHGLNVRVELPQGIVLSESSYDEILEVYGTPDSKMTGSVTYYPTEDGKFQLLFDSDNILDSIVVKNEVVMENDYTKVNEEYPDFLNDYVEPLSLGSSPMEATVKWHGDLYVLPVPISALEANGWTVVEYRIESIPAKQAYGNVLYVERDGLTEPLSLYNIADYETLPTNCVVLEFYDGGTLSISRELILSGGIRVGSTYDEVAALLDMSDISENDSRYRLTVYDEDTSVWLAIDISKETNAVESIEIQCTQWDF